MKTCFTATLIFLLMAGEASLLAGQDDSTDQIDEWEVLEDERIVESAARHQQEIGQSPSAIFVLTREDIAASGATNVVNLLRLVPGFEVKISTQAFPSTTARTVWSDEGSRMLVLVDGQAVFLELTGNVLWEMIPISLDDIERIEVIRGPASSLYGANAVAGVVNITTRAVPDRTSMWGTLQGGNGGFGAVGLRGSTKLGPVGLSLSGAGEQVLLPADHEQWGKRSWKMRAVAEYRFEGAQRLLLDGGVSFLEGLLGTTLGVLKTRPNLRTLRLSYEAPTWQAQIHWAQVPTNFDTATPLAYAGIIFAEVPPLSFEANMINAQGQWQAPTFWEPLLLILGGEGRISWLKSDTFLDGKKYTDPQSPGFHKPGMLHLEGRGSAFVHGEWTPWTWFVATADLRYDYNSITDGYLSPRLALVFQPVGGQFFRLSTASAFRKPSFLESSCHTVVRFPKSSPIQGSAQEGFLEFMSRVLGNDNLDNEELQSFEMGYWGEFLDKRLTLTLDLYYNIYRHLANLTSNIVYKNGFPDITQSRAQFENDNNDIRIFGLEFSARLNLTRKLILFFSWSHRETDSSRVQIPKESLLSPKNYLTLGGRFHLDSGFIGSLYAFARSDFYDPLPHNTGGLFAAANPQYKNVQLLLFGKLGWRWLTQGGFELETGLKLAIPLTPSAEPYWGYVEKEGTLDRQGRNISEEFLQPTVISYLQGAF